jgi:fatty aldehyde-generating acyl-ACP reductase
LCPAPIRALDGGSDLHAANRPVLGGCVGHNCRIGSGMVIFPARTIESDVVLFASAERRVIDKNVSYEDSDHHRTTHAHLHRRLVPAHRRNRRRFLVRVMDRFAFIIHPIHPKRDVSRKYPRLGRLLSEKQIDFFSTFFPPVYISEITGVVSEATGKEVGGWFLACPLTPRRMLELPVNTVYRKIIQTGRKSEELGAQILGLGAFTSVVGDSGQTIADALDVPVTTGDALTVEIAVEAIVKAAEVMEIDLASSTTAVVGATGAIGQVCAELLAEQVGELLLIGRRDEALHTQAGALQDRRVHARVTATRDLAVLSKAHVILTVTNDVQAVIQPEHLRPGCVVCDVARPRDVSTAVAAVRQDVLVIDGGMVSVPGPVNFNFDFGFPPGKAYACMAETMALALEGRFEDYTVGKQISRSRVDEISLIARRHGFRLSGFRSFERAVTAEQIAGVKAHVQRPVQVPVSSLSQGRS